MQKIALVLIGLNGFFTARAQSSDSLLIKVMNQKYEPLAKASVELLESDSTLIKISVTDGAGLAYFQKQGSQQYLLRTSSVGYTTSVTLLNQTSSKLQEIVLEVSDNRLQGVTVIARKPFIELHPDKTVVNIEAGIANVGITALEALEKLPGVSVDKDGNISLKGKSGVLVMLDGKPTYLNGSELSTLLNGMSASQLAQVELMDNPSARYDAAGNAGIINIKMKKNNQRGFHGTVTTSYSQGYYPKSNNNISVNYKHGNWNFYTNYSLNISNYFTRIYALRTYFNTDGSVASLLEQPSFLKGDGNTNNLRTGIDYAFSSKTSIGLMLSGLSLQRNGNSNNPAQWMKANGTVDSVIHTISTSSTKWENIGASVNFRHSFTAKRELSADADILSYRIRGNQYFENNSVVPGNYSEAFKANIPTDIHILSAKADYTEQVGHVKLEGGWKSSKIKTDNLAAYQKRETSSWEDDYGRSNHFIYEENIHAFYGSAQATFGKLALQGGLRYEMTAYDANQLGNQVVKDSSFSRKYNSLFPSFSLSFEKDSSHTFSLSASRRIDRPALQKLNPFLFIINKYTYQQGNPFYRPQYTWNLELNHLYKNILITGLSYSVTTDYFSQIFPIDSNGIVLYTEGNLGRLQNMGASAGLQLAPEKWWSFSLQGILNMKRMEGFISGKMTANITQYQINLNNQFRFAKGWGAELSGFYNSTSQHDIQEIVDPAGQLSFGISKGILQNKGTLKLAVRDLFYTNWMKGLTYFDHATEYFKLTRDTRMATISFTWRFGKVFKTNKRSTGASGDEIERVGNG